MIAIICGVLVLLLALIICACASGFAALTRAATGGTELSVRLVDLKKKHARRLRQITSQKKTMKPVGDGRPWSRKKVGRFLEYNAREQKEGENRVNYYWGIETASGYLVGVAGVHPVSYGKPETVGKMFLTAFLDQGEVGKGIGTDALRKALTLFWQSKDVPVYSDIGAGNSASIRVGEKLGFVEVGEVTIRGKNYRRFRKDKNEKFKNEPNAA